jgi:hypothetical protein
LKPDVLTEIHAALWDVPDEATGITQAMRNRNYRLQVVNLLAVHDVYVEEKSVTRHAEHVELTGKLVERATNSGERQVFAIDYHSMTDRAANMAVSAFEQIAQRVNAGGMEDRELVQVAKMGMVAVADREKLRVKEVGQDKALAAIMLIASGGARELPEGEVFDGVSITVLQDEMAQEREALMLNAGYGGDKD